MASVETNTDVMDGLVRPSNLLGEVARKKYQLFLATLGGLPTSCRLDVPFPTNGKGTCLLQSCLWLQECHVRKINKVHGAHLKLTF